jgi:glycosyltransferase involved in cell wall biosynthesis
LACGTPVAASDVPAIREVLGDRVILTDVADLDGLIAAGESASRPASAPPDWSWGQAAEATWKVYAEALDAPNHGRRRRGGHVARPAA